MKHYRHIVRALLLLVVILLSIFLARKAFIPISFGQYGPYRGAHLQEEMSAAPVYQGDDYCLECHETEWNDVADGQHVSIPCEDCHFLPIPHAKGEKKLAEMPVDKSHQACVICHIYLSSRPVKFPQVKDFDLHYSDNWKSHMGLLDKSAPCAKCHQAHKPRYLKRKIDD